MSDKWNVGTLNKPPIWSYYVFSNYCGFFLCSILIYSVVSNRKREVSDIFVAGIAFGCAILGLSCGSQCFANLIAKRFIGADAACIVESSVHISSIVIEFFCVTGMSLSLYLSQVKSYNISHKKALAIVIGICMFSTFITCLLNLVSRSSSLSTGLYCFPEFTSPSITLWLIPALILALTTMITTHILVMRHYEYYRNILINSNLRVEVPSSKRLAPLLIQQFRWKSFIFIIVLLVCWFNAVITCIYEYSHGNSSQTLVALVGFGGTSYNMAMPITYAVFCEHYRKTLIYIFGWVLIPCKGQLWWQTISNTHPHFIFKRTDPKRITKPSVNKPSYVEREINSPSDEIEIISLEERPSSMYNPHSEEKYFMPSPLADQPYKEVETYVVEVPSVEQVPTEHNDCFVANSSTEQIHTEGGTFFMASPLADLIAREGEEKVPPSPKRSRKETLQTPSPKRSRSNTLDPPPSPRRTPTLEVPTRKHTPSNDSPRYNIKPNKKSISPKEDPSPVHVYTFVDTNNAPT